MWNQKIINCIKNKIPFYQKKLFKSKLTSWKEIEKLLNCRPFVNTSRFKIPSGYSYGWDMQEWLTDVNTYPPSVVNKIIKKHWFYIIDCSRINKKINSICKYLEDLTGMPSDTHIFISNKPNKKYDNKSFGKHKDTQDNLIISVEGSQKIAIYKKDNPNELEFEKTLKSGDAVFIPAGRFHKITGLEKRLSVSFPMVPTLIYPKQEREWITLS